MRSGPEPYAPCPCGRGHKYKFCCREADRKRAREKKSSLIFIDEDRMREAERIFREGQTFIEHGDFRRGRPLLEKSIRLFRHAPAAHNNLAASYFLEGEFEVAARITRDILEKLDPNHVYALGALVHYCLLLGRDDEAVAAADRLQRLAPSDGSGAFKQCEGLARLGRHDRVYRIGRLGLGMSGGCHSHLFYLLGIAAANLGRYEEAEQSLKQARGDPLFGDRPKLLIQCDDLAQQIVLERIARRIFRPAVRCWERFQR